MNKNTNTKLLIIGVALLLCLPTFAIITGIYAYVAPRQYYSKTVLEFHSSRFPEILPTFLAAAQPFRNSTLIRQVRNTEQFEIGVYDAKPQQAADRANFLAATVQQKLLETAASNTPSSDLRTAATEAESHGSPVKIHEQAEPSLTPAKPNVRAIMLLGIGIGFFFAFFGVILLVIRFASRTTNVPNQPKVA